MVTAWQMAHFGLFFCLIPNVAAIYYTYTDAAGCTGTWTESISILTNVVDQVPIRSLNKEIPHHVAGIRNGVTQLEP